MGASFSQCDSIALQAGIAWFARPPALLAILAGDLPDARDTEPLQPRFIAPLAIDLADINDVARAQDTIYRDIKAADIFLTKRRDVESLDFAPSLFPESMSADRLWYFPTMDARLEEVHISCAHRVREPSHLGYMRSLEHFVLCNLLAMAFPSSRPVPNPMPSGCSQTFKRCRKVRRRAAQ